MPSAVNTGKVKDRRPVKFQSFAQAGRDIEQLAQAERDGRLQPLGNWTLGQAVGHLAAWIDYGFDGYPMGKPPLLMRIVGKVMRGQFLRGGAPAGFRIRGAPTGTYADEVIPTDEAIRRFSASAGRLEAAPPAKPNPVFGPMSHEEWKQLHLRHAELHLSFFKIK